MKRKTATEAVMEEAEKQRTEFIYSIIERIEKIESKLNLTGTARECNCANDAIPRCPIHGFKNIPRQCTCRSEDFPCEDCPLHGWIITVKKGQEEYQRFNPTPDLPLNAKVAEANGRKNIRFYNGTYRPDLAGKSGNWLMDTQDGRDYEIIPPYSTDLEVMIEAANTYFDKFNLKWGLCHLPDSIDKGYYQAYYFKDANKDRGKFVCGETAAEALSRLVVSHAESR